MPRLNQVGPAVVSGGGAPSTVPPGSVLSPPPPFGRSRRLRSAGPALPPPRSRLDLAQPGRQRLGSRGVPPFPGFHTLASVSVADLLGRGTSCLVWSSRAPGDTAPSLRYIDLVGPNKPHLLRRMTNNLGAETHLHYARPRPSSTSPTGWPGGRGSPGSRSSCTSARRSRPSTASARTISSAATPSITATSTASSGSSAASAWSSSGIRNRSPPATCSPPATEVDPASPPAARAHPDVVSHRRVLCCWTTRSSPAA